MRILANENFAGDAIVALRDRGHDVTWVHTAAPGSNDREVLAIGRAEGRLIVTFDKDFGELAVRRGLAAEAGVVLFRIRQVSSSFVARVVVAALESRSDWAGHFSVVDETRVRMLDVSSTREV